MGGWVGGFVSWLASWRRIEIPARFGRVVVRDFHVLVLRAKLTNLFALVFSFFLPLLSICAATGRRLTCQARPWRTCGFRGDHELGADWEAFLRQASLDADRWRVKAQKDKMKQMLQDDDGGNDGRTTTKKG